MNITGSAGTGKTVLALEQARRRRMLGERRGRLAGRVSQDRVADRGEVLCRFRERLGREFGVSPGQLGGCHIFEHALCRPGEVFVRAVCSLFQLPNPVLGCFRLGRAQKRDPFRQDSLELAANRHVEQSAPRGAAEV